VSPRLYGLGGDKGASDPALDGNYTATLREQCKPGRRQRHARRPGPHHPGHLRRRLLRARRRQQGPPVLSTDAALLGYPATRDYVERQAKAASPDEFFAEAFVAMSRLDVLTHHKGERNQEGLLQGQPAVRVTQPAGGGAVPVVQRRRRCRC